MSTPGSKILLGGPPGSGKTHAIPTLAECGIQTNCIFTESGFGPALRHPKVGYMHIPSARGGFETLHTHANQVNTMTMQGLAKLSGDKMKHTQFLDVISACASFTDARSGKDWGSAEGWGTDMALVVDGLTGLSKMAKHLTIGSRANLSQPEWGVSMDNIEKFVDECLALQCHFVLICHLADQKNDLTGEITRVPHTLGQKLAPVLGVEFSDVIFAQRLVDKFSWSTIEPSMTLKANNVPWTRDLLPSFKPLIEKWKSQGGVICPKEG